MRETGWCEGDWLARGRMVGVRETGWRVLLFPLSSKLYFNMHHLTDRITHIAAFH